MTEKNIKSESKKIRHKFLVESYNIEHKFSDGKQIKGYVSESDRYEPIIWALIGSPFLAGLIWSGGAIIMLFLGLDRYLFWDFGGVSVAAILYIIIYAIALDKSLKRLVQKVANENANRFFALGVDAALEDWIKKEKI